MPTPSRISAARVPAFVREVVLPTLPLWVLAVAGLAGTRAEQGWRPGGAELAWFAACSLVGVLPGMHLREHYVIAGLPALAVLAGAADGSLRDALSLLDQAIAYCGGQVEEESLALMLGTIDRDHVVRLLRHLAAGDAAAIIDLVAELDEQFPDYARLLEDLARMLQRIAVYQLVGAVDADDELAEVVLEELTPLFDPADVQLFYQTALMGRRDLPLAPDPRSGAEMTLLRMLAFRPASAELVMTASR